LYLNAIIVAILTQDLRLIAFNMELTHAAKKHVSEQKTLTRYTMRDIMHLQQATVYTPWTGFATSGRCPVH